LLGILIFGAHRLKERLSGRQNEVFCHLVLAHGTHSLVAALYGQSNGCSMGKTMLRSLSIILSSTLWKFYMLIVVGHFFLSAGSSLFLKKRECFCSVAFTYDP